MTGDAIFDLGIGGTRSRSTPIRQILTRRLSSWTTASLPRPRLALLVECGVVPAAVNLGGQDLSGRNPELIEILDGDERGVCRRTTTDTRPGRSGRRRSETYLIEEIERVWAGEITAEEYLAGSPGDV